MGNLIALVAPSGFGKSSSLFKNEELGIKGLDPKETAIVNISGKPLPMRGANKFYPLGKGIKEGGNHICTEDPNIVSQVIDYVSESRLEINNLVIDDSGYLMGLESINKAKVKSFDKWTDLAVNMMQVINSARKSRPTLNIIMTFHMETGDNGIAKIKTMGKMIDNTILLDGLFTTILYGVVIPNSAGNSVEYKFRTHGDGTSTCKTPIGMFKEDLIPNDMGYVMEKMNDYYNG